MITRRLVLQGVSGVLLPQLAMAQSHGSAPPAGEDGWLVGPPSEAGLDSDALSELVAFIDAGVTVPNVHALLIEHEGTLVFEHYWPGEDGEFGYVVHGPTTLHDIRSITKSVTSLLLGVALGSAANESVNRSISSHLGGIEDRSNGLPGVTLHHVLTMTAGLSWNEALVAYDEGNDYIRMLTTPDPTRFVLEKEIGAPPGSQWTYNSGLTEVAALVLEELTGTPMVDYAEETLFGPLGITDYEWWRPPEWPSVHFPSASAGLRLRARDLAKIGSLALNKGVWRGRQVVPKAWIKLSTKRHVETGWGPYGYGYYWFAGRLPSGHPTVRASGWGGQRVFVLPKQGLAITILAGNYDTGGGGVGERIALRVVRALG